MKAAVPTKSPSVDAMAWTDICQRYPEAWVYLVDIEWEPGRVLDIRRARVLDHATTRKQLARDGRGEASGHGGPYFTGLVEVHVANPQWLR